MAFTNINLIVRVMSFISGDKKERLRVLYRCRRVSPTWFDAIMNYSAFLWRPLIHRRLFKELLKYNDEVLLYQALRMKVRFDYSALLTRLIGCRLYDHIRQVIDSDVVEDYSHHLILACKKRDKPIIAMLLTKMEKLSINRHGDCHTALSMACTYCTSSIVKMLLDAGALPYERVRRRATPLGCAIEVGSLEKIQLLLDAGVRYSIGRSALRNCRYATISKNLTNTRSLEVVKFFIDYNGSLDGFHMPDLLACKSFDIFTYVIEYGSTENTRYKTALEVLLTYPSEKRHVDFQEKFDYVLAKAFCGMLKDSYTNPCHLVREMDESKSAKAFHGMPKDSYTSPRHLVREMAETTSTKPLSFDRHDLVAKQPLRIIKALIEVGYDFRCQSFLDELQRDLECKARPLQTTSLPPMQLRRVIENLQDAQEKIAYINKLLV